MLHGIKNEKKRYPDRRCFFNNVLCRRSAVKYPGMDRFNGYGYEGLIGMQVIRRFNFILDCKNNILYLKPNEYFKEETE